MNNIEKIGKPLSLPQLLEGCDVIVKTEVGDVRVTIKKVEIKTRTVEIGPSTPQNDWYPPMYSLEYYELTFTNGKIKQFDSLQDLKFYI
jgi:hypothetical protein